MGELGDEFGKAGAFKNGARGRDLLGRLSLLTRLLTERRGEEALDNIDVLYERY